MTKSCQFDCSVSFFSKNFCRIFLGVFGFESRKNINSPTFFEDFSRKIWGLKACIQNAFFFHLSKCITKKDEKSCKKGVDRLERAWYYIQVVAIRQQNKSQNRKTLAKRNCSEPTVWTLKTEHKPRKKRMCGSSVLNARPSQITSF